MPDYPNVIIGSGSNPLIVEGAGWPGAKDAGPIGNPRIRTRIRCPKLGDILVYFEAAQGREGRGYVWHCFARECNEVSHFRQLEGQNFGWSVFAEDGSPHAYGLLKFINDHLLTNFDALHVINDGSIAVHRTLGALC